MTTARQAPLRQIAGPASPPADCANHVVVAGTIAAGKTTLTNTLSASLGLPAVTERPDENPFLERFYEDQKRWALASQLWFASDSIRQHREIHRSKGAVQDHSVYENVFVFGAALAEHGALPDDEWQLLRAVTGPTVEMLPAPAIVVLVEAPPAVLMERIAARGRTYEGGIDHQYLALLNRIRHRFFSQWERSPVLLVESAAIDLRQPGETDIIAATVTEYLSVSSA